MKLKFSLIMCFFFKTICSLVPNKKRFLFNYKNPSSDIKLIDSKRAFLISKNWLDNYIIKIINENQLQNTKNLNSAVYDGINYVMEVNNFRKNIKTYNETHIYMSWYPQGCYGISENLYLVIAEKTTSNLLIKHIISSPYWESKQISNEKLKISLIDYSKNQNKTIDFDFLYENNIRHKLSWSTWNL
tara:strand:- start:3188 stop:3748 length:561 start_codon:yes stop_codon:yes gene_type:complete